MSDDQNPLRPIGGGTIPRQAPSVFGHRIYCSDCFDSGTVLAHAAGKPGAPYAFRCTCERGERSTRPYPSWRFANREQHEIVRAAS